MGPVEKAQARYSDRMLAATDSGSTCGEAGTRDAIRATLSGFDLDFEEVEGWLKRGVLATTLIGGTPTDTYISGAVSGLAIGLLIAEEREKAGQA